MKGMPSPFVFEGKGVVDLGQVFNNRDSNPLVSAFSWNNGVNFLDKSCFVNSPCARSPSASSSTMSSSLGGGVAAASGGGAGSTDSAGMAGISGQPKWLQDNTTPSSSLGAAESELEPVPLPLEIGGVAPEKCTMEELESVLSESVAASPSQEQSILRWIMGDVDDPSMANLNKVLQGGGGGGGVDYDFHGGFPAVDQGFAGDPIAPFAGNFIPTAQISGLPRINGEKLAQNQILPPFSNNLGPSGINQLQQCSQETPFDNIEMKPQIFNTQMLINQHQSHHPQNPSFFLPLPYSQQEQGLVLPPSSKRHNPGVFDPSSQILKSPIDTGQEIFIGRNQNQNQNNLPHHLQLLPHYQRAMNPKDESNQLQQMQQGIIDQLYKAAELVHTGNPVLAQGILARLNHQLSPIGKPFSRAAFYCKEALQLLLHANNNMNTNTQSPFSLIFKIGAHKSFSEISPVAQFTNFTCNQAILEVMEGFHRIHIVDFDIGYGEKWASLMQELVLKTGGAPSLKITALASPSVHDQLELGLTRENLVQFAGELNIVFEFEILSIESLNSASWSLPIHVPEDEAIAINLPVNSFSSYHLSPPLVLHFVKQLSPKIVVSVDKGCDRTDLQFPNHVIHALQSYSNLLESLDAVNVNFDALQKIERFLLQPEIERIVMGRYRSPEKTQHWRTLFLSSGLSPLTFSNFTESQAECVVKRTPVRGFHVEKRQSLLVLCWQRKELISASAWRC